MADRIGLRPATAQAVFVAGITVCLTVPCASAQDAYPLRDSLSGMRPEAARTSPPGVWPRHCAKHPARPFWWRIVLAPDEDCGPVGIEDLTFEVSSGRLDGVPIKRGWRPLVDFAQGLCANKIVDNFIDKERV